jgi:UDP-N-acetylmuramoyl-L-alanyl-D-glutamate--2,6-diaminopimelate ligase
MELVKLKKILKNVPDVAIRGSKDVEITGVSSNSKLIAPGNLFIAKKGLTSDGAQFIPDAVAAGAVAVVTDLYNPFFSHVVQVIVSDVPAAEALIAQEYYQHASSQLCLIGVTGTNGKTTTSYLIKHLLDRMGCPSGLIGTIECIVGQHYFPNG